jgi:hypothetical protein
VALLVERIKKETGAEEVLCLSAGKALYVLVPWPTMVEVFRERVERAKEELGVGLRV